MAIEDGAFVMPRTIVAALQLDGTPWLAQPPHVGVCSGEDGPPITVVDVLWDTGSVAAAQPIGTLLEIDVPDPASIAAFSGRVVRLTGTQSPEYIGCPVLLAHAVFDEGVDEGDFVVVKVLGPGNFYWAAMVANVEALENR